MNADQPEAQCPVEQIFREVAMMTPAPPKAPPPRLI